LIEQNAKQQFPAYNAETFLTWGTGDNFTHDHQNSSVGVASCLQVL